MCVLCRGDPQEVMDSGGWGTSRTVSQRGQHFDFGDRSRDLLREKMYS